MSTQPTASDDMRVLRPLINLALVTLPTLSPSERADLLEALFVAIDGYDADLAKEAYETASAIRIAETRQLTFLTRLQA